MTGVWQTGDMKKAANLLLIACIALAGGNVPHSDAMIMPYAKNLEQTAQSVDLVAKVQVISNRGANAAPAEEKKFQILSNPFWEVQRAKLKYISLVKGESPDKDSWFYFRSGFPMLKVQICVDASAEDYPHCDMRDGKSYLIFANHLKGEKSSETSKDYVQYSSGVSVRDWDGFIPCDDDTPLPANISTTKAVWHELSRAVKSRDETTQLLAAHRLFNLSASTSYGIAGSDDFKRRDVVALIFKDGASSLPLCRRPYQLKPILDDLAYLSPYRRTDTHMRHIFSSSVEAGQLASWAPWPAQSNTAIVPAFPFIFAVANDSKDYPPDVRAAAIACLGGLSQDRNSAGQICKQLEAWLTNKEPEILAMAVLLSSEYPALQSKWPALAAHKDSKVRSALYYAMGNARRDQDIQTLQKGLKDSDAKAAASAALSLMVYPAPKVKSILLANLKDEVFGEGFAAKLAQIDGAAASPTLLQVCQKPDRTLDGSGMTDKRIAFQNGLGTDTRYLCISALIKYLDAFGASELSKPQYQNHLLCLEKIASKNPSYTGKVYEMLRTHRLDARAALFKKQSVKVQPSLPTVCFDQVDMLIKAGETKLK